MFRGQTQKHSSETAQDNQTKGTVRRRSPGSRQETQLTPEVNASKLEVIARTRAKPRTIWKERVLSRGSHNPAGHQGPSEYILLVLHGSSEHQEFPVTHRHPALVSVLQL